MTWVIAMATPLGYITALSDVCVTRRDQKTGKVIDTTDCLQKLYGLENSNILVGFAGDIKNAFKVLDSLAKYAEQYKIVEPTKPLDIEQLLEDWVPIARKFHNYSGNGRIELIISAESMVKDNGLPGRGIGVVTVLKSPDYKIERKQVGKWASIGSGAGAQECIELLKNDEYPWHPLMKMEGVQAYGYGQALAIDISGSLKEKLNTEGISKYLLIGMSSREGISLSPNDHTVTHKDGTVEEFKVPKLCSSYEQLLKRLPKYTGSANIQMIGNRSLKINDF